MHPLDRVNLLLFALAGVLSAAIWYAPSDTRAWPPLTHMQPEAVREVGLYADGRLAWRARRDESGWRLTHPEETRADAERLDHLLELLRTPSLAHFAAAPDERARYGLDRPPYRLFCDGVELVFGGTEPTTGHRYVEVGGRVHLIGDGFLPYLAGGVARLRARGD